MKERPQVGDQELALLRFVRKNQPVSLRQVADEFGFENGLARTTVHTMLERLRKKRFLSRSKTKGVYGYLLAERENDVLQDLVASFVERTLGGSVAAFVAYLTHSKNLRPEEVEELRRLVDEMEEPQ